MDSIRKFFEDIKSKITQWIAGVARHAGRRARPAEPARPDSAEARERRALYTFRARLGNRGGRGALPSAGMEETRVFRAQKGRQSGAEHAGEPGGTAGANPGEGRQGYAIDTRARAARPRSAAGPAEPGGAADARPDAGRVEPLVQAAPGKPASRWAQRVSGRAAETGAGAVSGAAGERGGGKFRLFAPRKKPPNAVLGVAFTTLQLFVFVLLVLGMAGAGAVVGIAKAYADTAPVLDIGKIQDQDLTSFIYDGNGNLITTFAGMENREWAAIDEIPKNLQNAVIAIEDSRFMTHNGVDIKRIVGSFLSNMSSDSSQGGSTITQQLIKNTMVTSERTYKRKIQEAWLAMQLEQAYKKEQILEAYLNTIPLGESDYGVKTAAQDYFGKSLDALTLRECAMLAGLTQSPYLYDPRINTYTRNRMDITNKRTDTVLLCMYQQGYINKDQYEQALMETVTIQKANAKSQMYDMPYFVEYAIDDIKTHLLKSRNLEDTPENRSKIDTELRTGGYKIYLTVDPDIQKTVEDTLYNWKKYPKMKLSSYNTQRVSDGNGGYTNVSQPQAAAVVLDYRTGQLKAIVGGKQQPKAKRTLNRAYQQYMPVGSCIKPIAVYGPAIEKGMSPASIVYNVPAPVKGWKNDKGVDTYPSNYSGDPFTGPTSIRTGLIHSYNVIAARVLMDDVGLDDSYDTLMKLGVKQTSANNIKKGGAGLALGTSGITLVEMTGAYGTFGNKGEYIEPLSFTKIVDSKGGVVLDADQVRTRTQVFKPSTAWLMIDMMTDVIKSGTGTSAKISGMTVAGKTGTNSDYVGVSFNALTPYYAAAVWVGSDEYKPLTSGATGGKYAAPIYKDFMTKIIKLKGEKDAKIIPDSPESLGLVKATVCGVSGKLVTDACKADPTYKTVTDWFLSGTVPTEPCDLHWIRPVCKLTGKLATPFCPPDEVEQSSVLLVPQDSIIRSMKPADIQKYFPNAVLDYPGVSDLSQFTYDNPEYAQYFCPVHTQEWADLQPQYAELVGQANTLVAEVQQKTGAYVLTQEERDALNAKVKAVQDLVAKGFSDVTVPAETVVQSLQTAVDDLRSYANTVFVEPTPPPWEPTASPTPATEQPEGP